MPQSVDFVWVRTVGAERGERKRQKSEKECLREEDVQKPATGAGAEELLQSAVVHLYKGRSGSRAEIQSHR